MTLADPRRCFASVFLLLRYPQAARRNRPFPRRLGWARARRDISVGGEHRCRNEHGIPSEAAVRAREGQASRSRAVPRALRAARLADAGVAERWRRARFPATATVREGFTPDDHTPPVADGRVAARSPGLSPATGRTRRIALVGRASLRSLSGSRCDGAHTRLGQHIEPRTKPTQLAPPPAPRPHRRRRRQRLRRPLPRPRPARSPAPSGTIRRPSRNRLRRRCRGTGARGSPTPPTTTSVPSTTAPTTPSTTTP